MTELVPRSPSVVVRANDPVLPGTAERIAAGVNKNTGRSYKRVSRQYEAWCEENDRRAWPTTAAILADYIAHLCDLDKAPASIHHDMGVLSSLNQAAGYPALSKEVVQAARVVLRGHSKQKGSRQEEAPPVTRARLRAMSAACDPTTLAGCRDRLLLVVGWALAGRRSELVAINIEDITIEEDGSLAILIRSSKTDQDAAGEVVYVPAGEHVDTDPVGLLTAWLDALTAQRADARRGSLFRAVTQRDTLYRHGSLTGQVVNRIVRDAARRAGLPNWERYSGHSLRAGFATQAATDGIPLSIWARHGRWSPTSPIPHKYVRVADAKRDNPLKRMGL